MRVLILTAVIMLAMGCRPAEDSGPAAPVVAVKVARVETRDLIVQVRAPASIFPRQQANVAARITAPIRTLRVRKGDSVSAGSVLAELEDRDLLAQRSEAEAAVADAQAALEKTAAGSLPADVERARGQLASAQAALNQARQIYERRQELFRQGAIPQRDLLASETELAQARAGYEVAQKSLELLLNQSRERDIRMAESRLEQAKARLAYIQAQLDFTRLRSPFAGVITEQFLYPGDMAKPDAPVFTVSDLSVAVARAQVPEAEAAPVKLGQQCLFSSVDLPEPRRGQVTVVNQAVDPARRTVEVWCEIPNPGYRLRAGVFGEVAVITRVEHRALTVPQAAVQFQEGTPQGIAIVVDSRGLAHQREVLTGYRADGNVQILRGLSAGELVAVEGGYGLPDGTRVRVMERRP